MLVPCALLWALLPLPLAAAPQTEAEKLLAVPLGQTLESDSGGSASAAGSDLDDSGLPRLGCLLTPSLDVMIASPVVGVIEEVAVKKGSLVKKGDVLIQLRSEVEQATLRLNQAQADYGRRTIERNEELYRKSLISEQERDEIIITNRIYGYELEQTRAMLQQKTIRSPLDGVVVDTFLELGEYVGEEPVLNIVQLDPLHVEVVVPARYYGAIASGGSASVSLDKPWNGSYQATVDIVDQVLDAASGTFGVRLLLPNPDYRLPAGLKCEIRFSPAAAQVAR
ncbi:MAG: efflux RND transporter periplasmic adaptor subunit [Gammaproteobacteria bacterium]|uniref:efflux RND transporter periplasmic adaptor subunit n=1 Tax=Pseudomaricurvus alcaniphilus TaxID=1166482 RepID=UPI00140A3C2A|nr:efflux RND transporter periplasmic adaptor subunit [Pseudomaricurvus alcaniphilus]MBR9911349.1 efflux RND transporter periplasmic adaptor subunit [Gammaproteobacteria bacterium]NHN39534.1 efflux RND transporter periplasmic adaptor subunit [Pseudomaricurvus alcaniphilus]